MAEYDDKDRIKEYDNPMPGWLTAILWGSLIFAVSTSPSLRSASARARAWRPRTPRIDLEGRHGHRRVLRGASAAPLRGATSSPARQTPRSWRWAGRASSEPAPRATGEQAQGLIGLGPSQTLHFARRLGPADFPNGRQRLAREGHATPGWRLKPEELAALVSYVRSIQGSNPPSPARLRAYRLYREPISPGTDVGKVVFDVAPGTSFTASRPTGSGGSCTPSRGGSGRLPGGQFTSPGRRLLLSPASTDSEQPGGPARHRHSPLPCSAPEIHGQPPARCVRVRTHRHGLLRRFDVRADVVRWYACPQTVWLEFAFRPIEAFLEGGPSNQRKWRRAVAGGPSGARRRPDGCRAPMSSTFVVVLHRVGAAPARRRRTLPSQSRSWPAPSCCTSLGPRPDVHVLRARMAACIMADQDTILVAYDQKRGDPKVRLNTALPVFSPATLHRVPSLRQRARPGPTSGGAAAECIGSSDACDEVMRGGHADRPHRVHVGAGTEGRHTAPLAPAQPRLHLLDDRGVGDACSA